MNKEEGLAFLRNHIPMPDLDDRDETCRIFYEWTDVCDYFVEHPCFEALPLLMAGLAGGSDFEGFERIGALALRLPLEEVEPYFIESIKSPSSHVRYWSVIFASDLQTSNIDLFEAILDRADDPDEDDEVSVMSQLAICTFCEVGLFDWRPYKERILNIIERSNDKLVINSLTSLIND